MLAKASPRLAAPLQPKTAEEAGKLKGKLAMAGFRGETAVSIFLGLKFAALLVGIAIGGGAALVGTQTTDRALINAVGVAGVMFYVPSMVLWFITKQRKDSIFYGLPDALDLLVVCVEAGLGLDQAMRKVSEEMKKTCRTVTEEFGLCNFQLQMGRPRAEVLHELGVADGRRRSAQPGGDFDSGRQVRLEHRPGAAGAKRCDADQTPSVGRREGGQNRRETDLSAGDLHLSRRSSWCWSDRRPSRW